MSDGATVHEAGYRQLLDLLQHRELAVYLGSGLPEALTGAPSWSDLASRLAARGGWPDADWPVVATRYAQEYGRYNLVAWLSDQLATVTPGPIYRGLAALPVSRYIVATYDGLLQAALEAAGRPPNVVATDADLNFIRIERPTIVKLLGEASSGRRETLLLTQQDLAGLTLTRGAILAQEVQPTFTGLSLLILGQDLRAPTFQALYQRYALSSGASHLRHRSFALSSDLEDWERQQWAASQVTVLAVDPLDLLHRLSNDVSPSLTVYNRP